MSNADEPAYPDPMRGAEQSFHNQEPFNLATGITKRELISAMIAQGLAANPEWMIEYKGDKFLMMDKVAAEVSVSRADALIEELSKPVSK